MTRFIAVIVALGLLALVGPWASLVALTSTDSVDVRFHAAKGAAGSAVADAKTTMPAWAPLPSSGQIIASGVYPPQPPYGAAATVTLAIEGEAEAFAAAYAVQLAAAGFAVRRAALTDPLSSADLALEAALPQNGRTVICVLRHVGDRHFAQLTFWDPPVPRL